MKTVLLRFDGPLQAWGTRSCFELRDAGTEPSMSGALGLVASALGMPRTDDARLKRLAACWMAVRADREGRSLIDFHTVGGGDKSKRVHGAPEAVLTHRAYLADASYLAALGYDDHTLAEEIDAALEDPHWLLFLGRKCCIPSPRLRAGLVNADPETALRSAPWPFPERPERRVRLIVEAPYGQGEPRQDHPLSFRPGGRLYRRRWVSMQWIRPEDLVLPGEAPPASNAAEATAWARVSRREVLRPAVEPVTRVYLSRAFLNPQSDDVARDLKNCHAMHRRVMEGFFLRVPPGSEGARARLGVLYRIDHDRARGRMVLHVQSKSEPNWRTLPEGYVLDLMGAIENPATTIVSWTQIKAGDVFAFELRANATVNGERGRVGVQAQRRDPGMGDPLLAWLHGQAARHGFELRGEVGIVDEGIVKGLRPRAGESPLPLTFAAARFEGQLEVRDPDLLRAALVQGIGRGLAFGFGYLSVSRASRAPGP